MDVFFLSFFFSAIVASAAILFVIWYAISRERQFRDISASLHLRLFKVLIPPEKKYQDDARAAFQAMEQVFKSLSGLRWGRWKTLLYGAPAAAFEIALPEGEMGTVLYVAVPRFFAHHFQQLVDTHFPGGRLEETTDYNVFPPDGVTAAAYLMLEREAVFPIRVYEHFDHDPFSVIAAAFAKLKNKTEGAAIQIMVRPARAPLNASGRRITKIIQGGKSVKEALKMFRNTRPITKTVGRSLGFISEKERKKHSFLQKQKNQGDAEAARLIESKAAHAGFDVNIRFVVSAESEEDATRIFREVEAVFSQFSEPQGNNFQVVPLEHRVLERAIYHFSFRIFNPLTHMYLATDELASLFRFPFGGRLAPRLETLNTGEAPPPPNLPVEGLQLGKNIYRGSETPVFINSEDRRQHMYIVGQTGTGKTSLMKNMILQDMQNGAGVCFIDPAGDTAKDLLGLVPKERVGDVVYIDPLDTERPLGINLFAYDERFPEQKIAAANEFVEILNKLDWINKEQKERSEQYARNAALLVMDDPASGNTLLEISRVLAEADYRAFKLSRSSNIVVKDFWKKVSESPDKREESEKIFSTLSAHLEAVLSDDTMRLLFAQGKNSIDFSEVVQGKKIVLVNLARGHLDESYSVFLGMIVIRIILRAAFSWDQQEEKRPDLYFYVDEFQNFATGSFASLLSEARKYRVNFIIAHQYVRQLVTKHDTTIKDAVFGNVGTIISFRTSADDAGVLAKQFAPVFSAEDSLRADNYHALIRLLIAGKPASSFNIETLPPEQGNATVSEAVMDLSRLKHGRTRSEVETEITQRIKKFS